MDCFDGVGGGKLWSEASDLALLREQCDRMERKLDRLTVLSEGMLRASVAEVPREPVGSPTAADGVQSSASASQLRVNHDALAVAEGLLEKRKPTGELGPLLPFLAEGSALRECEEGVCSMSCMARPSRPYTDADFANRECTASVGNASEPALSPTGAASAYSERIHSTAGAGSASSLSGFSQGRHPCMQELPELLPALASVPSSQTQVFVVGTLPCGWPSVLSIRSGFHAFGSCTAGRSRSKHSRRHSEMSTETPDLRIKDTAKVSRFMIDPNSRFHMVYSVCSLLVLVYDLTLLPYALAWDLDYTGWLSVSALCTSVFWSADILNTFMTGCYRDGDLHMDFPSVAKYYMRSWFVPDLAVVVSDWLNFLISELTGGANGGRSFKMLRFMKLGRLLRIMGMIRMLRIVRIFEDFAERSLSEGYRVAFNMVSLFSGIMWVAHLLCCVWFAVGKSGPSDTGARWTEVLSVQVREEDAVGFLQTGPLYQYAVAFHWAAGQIALGSLDVMPTNSLERLVFVSAMMVGFLFGSTLVSMLSAAMMDYQMMQKDKNVKLRTLRSYLRQNGVGPNVAMPVQKQVTQRLAQRVCLEEKDVAALSLLSAALRSQLRFEIQRPHLLQHSVFRLFASLDADLMLSTCVQAVNCTHLRPKDDLFAAGTTATSAYSLIQGEITYVQHPDSSPVDVETRTAVHPGSFLCEAALWTEWTHVGRAEAARSCTLLEINAEELVKCLSRGTVVRDLAAEYCKHFHKRVTAARPPHAPWPTDLEVPYTNYCDLVVCMAKEVQVIVGMDALSHLAKSRRPSKAMDKLTEEVRTAKSILVVTGEGSITRVVSLVVLRLENANDEILVQIGKWDGTQLEADCRLPGLKQERSELVSETVARMLGTKLLLLAGRVDIEGFSRENTENMSKEYGVQTRYLRSVCMARMSEDEGPLEVPVVQARSQYMSSNSTGREESGLLAALLGTEVLQVPSGTDIALYAWLRPETFEALSGGGSAADQALKGWLAQLPPPEKPLVHYEFEGDELVVVAI